MLLRNYDNYITCGFLGTAGSGTEDETTGGRAIKDVNNHIVELRLGNATRFPFQEFTNQDNNDTSVTTVNKCSVKWSSDTTDVNYSDYTMTLPASQGVNISGTNNFDTTTKKWIRTVTQKFLCDNPDGITVNTVAIAGSPEYYSPSKTVLYYKEKLSQGVFVPYNSVFVITINIIVPYLGGKPDISVNVNAE